MSNFIFSRPSKSVVHKFITFIILFIPGFYFSITLNAYLHDEFFHLQIVNRMMNGEILYREIYTAITPLSYYITLLFIILLGSEILVIKLINTIIFVCTVLISIDILKKITIFNRTYTVLLIITLFAYASPGAMGAGGIYNSLAILVFMFCFNITITWSTAESGGRVIWGMKTDTILIILGIVAGLCLLAKQNIGGLAYISILLSIITLRYPFDSKQYLRRICYVSVPFAITVTLALLTIWLNDAVESFWNYTVLSRFNWVETASISYIEGVKKLGDLIFNNPMINLRQIGAYMLFLIGPITFVMYIISCFFLSQNDRKRHIIVFWFLMFGSISIFPRADLAHVCLAAPIFTIGIIYSWHIIKPKIHVYFINLIRILLILWIGIWMRYLTGDFFHFTSDQVQISTASNIRGLIVPKTWYKRMIHSVEEIKKITGEEKTLILSRNSAFISLASNLKNPTPFDFHAVTSYGLDGEQGMINLIKSSQIKFVYINSSGAHPLAPTKLEQYVLNDWTLVFDLSEKGVGYIYTSP